jgi:hypothetical protein
MNRKDPTVPHNHLLLDWDGVVRANWYDYRDEPRDEYNYGRLHLYPVTDDGQTFHMLIDPDVIAAIHRWAARNDTTVYWISANGHWTYSILAPAAGLPPLSWAPHASEEPGQPGYPGSGFRSAGWWKAVAVRELVQSTKGTGDRILWVDDSISPDLHRWLDNTGRKRLSWLIPETRLGLLPEETARIDTWLDGAGPFRYKRLDATLRASNLPLTLDDIENEMARARELIDTASDEDSWQAAYDAARAAQKLLKELTADVDRTRKAAAGEF